MAYPTIRDATPAGLQETMWFGVPPVVFADTAPAYMVQDGVTGLLVRTEQQFVDRHTMLWQRPGLRLELGRNARQYAEEHFDPVKNAPDFEALLQRLAALPKRRHFSQAQLNKEKIARGTK
jgi:glycosyltransferase involved in cell wall biosynthesis